MDTEARKRGAAHNVKIIFGFVSHDKFEFDRGAHNVKHIQISP